MFTSVLKFSISRFLLLDVEDPNTSDHTQEGLKDTKLRQSSHLYPGWSHLLSGLWAWSIGGKDKLEINLMTPRILTFPIWPMYLFFLPSHWFECHWSKAHWWVQFLIQRLCKLKLSPSTFRWYVRLIKVRSLLRMPRKLASCLVYPKTQLRCLQRWCLFSILHSETYVELVIFWEFYRGTNVSIL